MLKTIFLTLCALCALLLVGCSKSETTNNNNNTSMANTSKPAMASSTPATMTSTPAAAAKTTDSGDKIGVPECDEFLAAYEACISKLPDVARAQYKATLASWRTAWHNAASTPQGKAGLAKTCKAVTEQTRGTMKNCTF